MFSNSFRYNTSTCSLRTFVITLVPPNDVSCSQSGSQEDPPIAPPGVRGIVLPVLSGCESVLSCSPNGSVSTSAIFS